MGQARGREITGSGATNDWTPCPVCNTLAMYVVWFLRSVAVALAALFPILVVRSLLCTSCCNPRQRRTADGREYSLVGAAGAGGMGSDGEPGYLDVADRGFEE